MAAAPPLLATLVRDDVVESSHRGHLVIAGADGEVRAALGDAGYRTYARSAVKPFQALATLDVLDAAGVPLEGEGLAIACASHTGTDAHQIEAAHLLARAGLDESALRCPASLPRDVATLCDQQQPTALAHNCSGKHAAFLLAQVTSDHDPACYLDPDSPLQRLVARHVAVVTRSHPAGPGVDGCGAPAWLLPLSGLAVAFARLAAGATPGLRRVRDAMQAHPFLVGGETDDTALMCADARVIAKCGAEGVLAAGLVHPALGPLGLVVKVGDGAPRAAGPTIGAALAALGAAVAPEVAVRPVLGGGVPHGGLRAVAAVTALASAVT